MNKQVKLNKKRIGICITLFFASIGSLLSYLKIFGESRDFQGYFQYFVSMESASDCFNEVSDSFEIGFHRATCFLAPIFQSADLLLAFLVFFALLLKLSTLWLTVTSTKSSGTQLLTCYFLSLILYFSKYFPIHELTQIRISLSIAFLFIATFIMLNEKTSFIKNIFSNSSQLLKSRLRLLFVFVLFFIAALFHFSSILAMPFLILSFYIKSRKNILIASVIIAVLTKFLVLSYSIPIIIAIIPRINDYLNPNYFDAVQFFSLARILDVILVIIGLLSYDSNNRYQTYFLNLYIFSILSVYCLADIPTLAYRFSELIQVNSIFLIAVMRYKKQLIFTVPWVVITSCSAIYTYYKGAFFVS